MIAAERLAKRLGRREVLRNLSFDVEPGGCLLVTGPNGSGKTTLLRLLTGLTQPTGGTLTIRASRREVGYLAHEPLLYRDLTALENLELFGRLYRVPERRERIGMLLERFGLWDDRSRLVGDYSRGMVQRLALCRTLLHAPPLLVLDEPLTALDAAAATIVEHELAELVGAATVVVSTHEPVRLEHLATARLALPAGVA